FIVGSGRGWGRGGITCYRGGAWSRLSCLGRIGRGRARRCGLGSEGRSERQCQRPQQHSTRAFEFLFHYLTSGGTTALTLLSTVLRSLDACTCCFGNNRPQEYCI